MDSGTYVAASGGLAAQRHLDIIGHNLANVSTVGFKAERVVLRQQSFSDTLASTIVDIPARAKGDQSNTPGVVDIATVTDFTPGPIAHTGNPLNVALGEKGQFFVVQTPNGEAYTRAGNFTRDVDGNLVTVDGFPVLGEGGPISLPEGSASITSNGSIMVDNEVIGRLRVVQIEDLQSLKRTEGVRFTLEKGGGKVSVVPASVVPASVEMPNVTAVTAMVEMINATKAFEAYTKTLKTIDELNTKAITSAKTTS